jgi:hypothetical protein
VINQLKTSKEHGFLLHCLDIAVFLKLFAWRFEKISPILDFNGTLDQDSIPKSYFRVTNLTIEFNEVSKSGF